jgi:hypothetical protein
LFSIVTPAAAGARASSQACSTAATAATTTATSHPKTACRSTSPSGHWRPRRCRCRCRPPRRHRPRCMARRRRRPWRPYPQQLHFRHDTYHNISWRRRLEIQKHGTW